jgi:hypothetical protein
MALLMQGRFRTILALACIGCVVFIQMINLLLGNGLEKESLQWNATTARNAVQDARVRVKSVFKKLLVVNATIPGNTVEKAGAQVQSKESVNPRVITLEGSKEVKAFMMPYFTSGAPFCKIVNQARKNASDAKLPITFNISFSCEEIFKNSNFGTGNFISLLYGMRLAVQVYQKVEMYFTCTDAEATKKELILPWLTGWFPPRTQKPNSRFSMVTIKQACGTYATIPMARMIKEMQYDFRRMAIGLVGVPRPDHPSAKFAEKYLWSESDANDEPFSVLQLPVPQRADDPPFPPGSIELDDAVIHFRCGDLIESNHQQYCWMKFGSYTKYISPEVRSIGILTQPFGEDTQTRSLDAKPIAQNRCRIIVMSLVDYIQERFPSSRIQIHNGPNETIALAYARMIMANQSIAGMSTFGVFPVLATFGTGYLRSPRNRVNNWVLNPRIDELTDNVVLVEESEVIKVAALRELWNTNGEEAVLAWFRNGTMR